TRQDRRAQQRTFDTANFPIRYYKEQDISFFESNTDALLSSTDKIVAAVDFRASPGGKLIRRQVNANDGIPSGMPLPGISKLSNALTVPLAENQLTGKEVHSVYGFMNFGWENKIFVDITGRNDWSSTLPAGNNSYFYPSVSTSYILSDLFTLPSTFSFAKLR